MSPERGGGGGAANRPACRLYLITPPTLDVATFPADLAAALDGGDVACVQLRLATADAETLRGAARALAPVCQERGAAFLIEGHADVAAQTRADGVHIRRVAAIAGAKRMLGADAMIGVSCGGSRHAAIEAGEADCDYVSFGAFFPSPTIPDAAIADPGIVGWWSGLMVIPCVAVGGLTPGNCGPLVAAGADFIATSSAVWSHAQGPAAAVAAFNEAIVRAGRETT